MKQILLSAVFLLHFSLGYAQNSVCEILAKNVATMPIEENINRSNYKKHMKNLLRYSKKLNSKTLKEAEGVAAGANIPLKNLVIGFSGSYDEQSYQNFLKFSEQYQKNASLNIDSSIQKINRTYANYKDVLMNCVNTAQDGFFYYGIPSTNPNEFFLKVNYRKRDFNSPTWAKFQYSLDGDRIYDDSVMDGDNRSLRIMDTTDDDISIIVSALNVKNPDSKPIFWVRNTDDNGDTGEISCMYAYSIRFTISAGEGTTTKQPLEIQLIGQIDSSRITLIPSTVGLDKIGRFTTNHTVVSRINLGEIKAVKIKMRNGQAKVDPVKIESIRIHEHNMNTRRDWTVQKWVGVNNNQFQYFKL